MIQSSVAPRLRLIFTLINCNTPSTGILECRTPQPKRDWSAYEAKELIVAFPSKGPSFKPRATHLTHVLFAMNAEPSLRRYLNAQHRVGDVAALDRY